MALAFFWVFLNIKPTQLGDGGTAPCPVSHFHVVPVLPYALENRSCKAQSQEQKLRRNRFDSWLSCPGVKSSYGEPVPALTEPPAITRAVAPSPVLACQLSHWDKLAFLPLCPCPAGVKPVGNAVCRWPCSCT